MVAGVCPLNFLHILFTRWMCVPEMASSHTMSHALLGDWFVVDHVTHACPVSGIFWIILVEIMYLFVCVHACVPVCVRMYVFSVCISRAVCELRGQP